MRRRIAGVVLACLLAVTGWLVFRGLQIRSDLLTAYASLSSLSEAAAQVDINAVRRHTARATESVDAAQSAADDPIWRSAAALPWAGRSFQSARDLARVAGLVVNGVGPPAERALAAAESPPLFANGRVDLSRLSGLRPHVNAALTAAQTAQRAADGLPSGGVPGRLQRYQEGLALELAALVTKLTRVRDTLDIAPALLGATAPRRYFLAVQNNAETRGTGGLIGAYAILRVDKGRLSRERVGTDLDLIDSPTPVVDLGPGFAAQYDADSVRSTWRSAVITPDWPSASRIITGLWRAQGGGELDGVLSVDALALAEIMRATGPVKLGSLTLTGDTVADFVMRDEYAIFENRNDERKRALAQLAAAIYDGVASGGTDSTALLRAAGKSAREGHLLVWSAREEEQRVLATARPAGALPGYPTAFLEVVSNNASGNKADYYVRRRVAYDRRDGTARVTVTLTNLVRPSEVPPFVLLRVDRQPFRPEPGATRQIVTVFVGLGNKVRAMTVDGRPVPLAAGNELGHGWGTVQVEIVPGRETVITADVDDPGGVLLYRQQPLVVPDELRLNVPYRIG